MTRSNAFLGIPFLIQLLPKSQSNVVDLLSQCLRLMCGNLKRFYFSSFQDHFHFLTNEGNAPRFRTCDGKCSEKMIWPPQQDIDWLHIYLNFVWQVHWSFTFQVKCCCQVLFSWSFPFLTEEECVPPNQSKHKKKTNFFDISLSYLWLRFQTGEEVWSSWTRIGQKVTLGPGQVSIWPQSMFLTECPWLLLSFFGWSQNSYSTIPV